MTHTTVSTFLRPNNQKPFWSFGFQDAIDDLPDHNSAKFYIEQTFINTNKLLSQTIVGNSDDTTCLEKVIRRVWASREDAMSFSLDPVLDSYFTKRENYNELHGHWYFNRVDNT